MTLEQRRQLMTQREMLFNDIAGLLRTMMAVYPMLAYDAVTMLEDMQRINAELEAATNVHSNV